MRILSAKVFNYRIHKELSVEFDSRLTLIGGLNESGKSTLVEAIHRCLFLTARGNTKWHQGMKSLTHLGTPEVELKFEVRGERYTLTKRFSGANGTVRVVDPRGKTTTGEAAEAQLQELLSIEQKNRNDLHDQWSHLWVWQGSSASDPATKAVAEHDGLIQRLQDMGGAVAMQSELDSAVASQFKDERETIFTANGAERRGSDLAKASDAVAQALSRLEAAKASLEKLRSARDLYLQAQATIAQLATDRESLDTQSQINAEKLRELNGLRELERDQAAKAKLAAEKHAALDDAEQRIVATQEDIAKRTQNLAPGQEELCELDEQIARARADLEDKNQAAKAASGRVAATETLRDYYDAQDRFFDLQRQEASLKQRLQQIEAQEIAFEELKKSLADLPGIEPTDVADLRAVEGDLRAATARLEGMSTEIEVFEAEHAIKVQGEELSVGSSRTFAEPADLFHNGLRLRIKPGGGDGLNQAREEVIQAEASQKLLMDRLGVSDLDKASAIATKRGELKIQIKHAEEALKGSAPQKTRKEWEELSERLKGLQKELEQLSRKATGADAPKDASTARATLLQAKEGFLKAKAGEQEAKAERDAATEALTQYDKKAAAKRRELEEEKQALQEAQVRLRVLEDNHGDEAKRLSALAEAKHARDLTAAELKGILVQIEALQPAMLESDQKRLVRALEQNHMQTQQMREQRAGAQAALRLDGATDPAADVELAQGHLIAAQEVQARVLLRARSIDLLATLFDEEQIEVAERFSAPLAERVSEYLKAIYGPDANAALEVSKDKVSGIAVRRANFDGIGFDFANLSMGAQEQAAAAVRLAIAEVLANCPDDCLPVVFDDAFTNCDPERTRTLQRMLDHAATKGLQIIVLTCNPSDYAALGASTSFLMPAAAQSHSNGGTSDSIPVNTDVDPEQLLEVLSTMGGQAGNQKLREALDWDEATYERIKETLVSRGKLEKGRGRGGGVCLPELDGSMN